MEKDEGRMKGGERERERERDVKREHHTPLVNTSGSFRSIALAWESTEIFFPDAKKASSSNPRPVPHTGK